MRSLLLTFCLFVDPSNLLFAHDFEWKPLLIASLKLQQNLDLDANVDSYMEVFRPDVWKRYHNDEFEMVGKRKETIEIMKRAIESFSLQETFVIRTSTEFRNYDFASKKFPLDGWNESSYFYSSHYPHGQFPSAIRAFFSNPKMITQINMGEAQAKEFLQSRKNRNGDIDRTVYVHLTARIVRTKSDPSDLVMEIVKYRIYADSNHTKLLYEFDAAKTNGDKEAKSKEIVSDLRKQPSP